jgi:predicted amidohydrolase YtcJ
VVEDLHAEGLLTVRIACNLFTQRPKEELADFSAWAKQIASGQDDDTSRVNGAGEMLVYSAADYEDFKIEMSPDVPLEGLPWFFDHAETIDERISTIACQRPMPKSNPTCGGFIGRPANRGPALPGIRAVASGIGDNR